MKKYKFSFVYTFFLAIISFFHFQIETLIYKYSADTFLLYIIYGLFFSFFLVFLVWSFFSGNNLELAIALLVMGLIFFFLFSKSVFIYKLSIIEFFVLGVLVSFENKKSKSLLPFLILLVTACLIELITNLSSSTRFYYLDVWINSITALSGYIVTFMLL